MNKYLATAAILIIISGITGYIYYKKWSLPENIEVWHLIPDNAIAVYESRNAINNWNNLQEKALWSTLKEIPFFSELDDKLVELDSLSGKKGYLDKLIQHSPLYISLHKTSKESFGTTLYVKISEIEAQDAFNNIIKSFKENGKYQPEESSFLGEHIVELKEHGATTGYSYIIYKGFFIGSSNPVLIEDVIRYNESADLFSFKNKNSSLFNITETAGEEENFFINGRKLNELFVAFSDRFSEDHFMQLLLQSMRLNLETTANNIYLNGYSLSGNDPSEYYLSTFKGQEAGRMEMKKYIPNRTAHLYHYTFHDGGAWHNNLLKFWSKNIPRQEKNIQSMALNYEFEPLKFYKWMSGEIGLATLQSLDTENPDKLLIIKASDIHEAYNQINRLSARAEEVSGDSMYVENFAGIDIRHLSISEFPAKLLGLHFGGFKTSYYAAMGNYLVLANSVQALKGQIVDMETDNTWGKSVATNQFLESILQESNISIIVNTERSWNFLNKNINKSWRGKVEENSKALKNFKMLSLQFSNFDNKFYTSLNLRHQPLRQEELAFKNFQLARNISVEAPIVTKPFFVRSTAGDQFEVLFQDSLFNLYNISSDGEIHFKDSIGAPIISEIYKIDYSKNGEKNYAFATSSTIFIIDNNGNPVNNRFPYHLNRPIEHLSVIDYDNSKNYRFLVAENRGALYMFDKEMEGLDGWRPRQMSHKPAAAPFHLRVRGKDFIVSLQENGELNVMNRKGESYSGFPLNLPGIYNRGIFVEAGPSFAETTLTTLSVRGELIKVNLEGKIVKREQLYRPSKETKFTLCIDEFNKNYIIARQQLGILTILNAKGEVILEKDYITSGALEVQYFNAGFEKEIYAVTDKVQEFTYLYDFKGNLINSRPIDSGHKVALNYSEVSGKYEIMANYDVNFSIIGFSR